MINLYDKVALSQSKAPIFCNLKQLLLLVIDIKLYETGPQVLSRR